MVCRQNGDPIDTDVDVDGVAAAGWNDRSDRSSGVRFSVTASPASSRPRSILYQHDHWNLRRRCAPLPHTPPMHFLGGPPPPHTHAVWTPEHACDTSSDLGACWSPWSEPEPPHPPPPSPATNPFLIRFKLIVTFRLSPGSGHRLWLYAAARQPARLYRIGADRHCHPLR